MWASYDSIPLRPLHKTWRERFVERIWEDGFVPVSRVELKKFKGRQVVMMVGMMGDATRMYYIFHQEGMTANIRYEEKPSKEL